MRSPLGGGCWQRQIARAARGEREPICYHRLARAQLTLVEVKCSRYALVRPADGWLFARQSSAAAAAASAATYRPSMCGPEGGCGRPMQNITATSSNCPAGPSPAEVVRRAVPLTPLPHGPPPLR